MEDDETGLVAKVESRQEDLLAIYSEVFSALSDVDRNEYSFEQLQRLDEALDDPKEIEPPKAIAILKSILRSTSKDKILLEDFYGAPIKGSTLIGWFVSDRISALGITRHDIYPYLRDKGWLRD